MEGQSDLDASWKRVEKILELLERACTYLDIDEGTELYVDPKVTKPVVMGEAENNDTYGDY